jgi:hypothetical protein
VEPTDHHEREDIAADRADRLIALVRPHLPIEVRITDLPEVWGLVGPALLARQVGTLEAIFALRPLGREADALTLLRSLYEHAVTFVWLAADPGAERLGRFRKSDLISRLELDKDMRRLGEPPLSNGVRRRFATECDALPDRMPKLEKLTEEADGHWAGSIPRWQAGTVKSYRGLYASAYRRQSMVAHPSEMGLNGVFVDLPDGRKRIQLEGRDPEMRGPFGLGVIVFAFSLYVAGRVLGWPRASAVDAAFD